MARKIPSHRACVRPVTLTTEEQTIKMATATDTVVEVLGGESSVDLDRKDSHQIQSLLEDTQASNGVLEKENHMFEQFLKLLDPKDFQLKVPSTASSHMDLQRKRVRIQEGADSQSLLRLSMDQKCNIATRELDELREKLQRDQEEAQINYDNLRAVVQEADQRLAELKKATYEFDRDVLRGSVNPRTNKIMGEKVVKYFEDRIKSRDILADKLRSKSSSYKVKRRKLQIQLKTSDDTGEVRNEVDFKQLQIENQQLNEKCEEKNHELLRLKVRAAKALQILNTYKKKLHALTVESKAVDREIKQRRELQGKVDKETITVTKEKEKAEAVNTSSRQRLEDYKVPDVMEYVQERASLYELTKAVRTWERKVEISEMALRTYRQTWKRLCSTHHHHHHHHDHQHQQYHTRPADLRQQPPPPITHTTSPAAVALLPTPQPPSSILY